MMNAYEYMRRLIDLSIGEKEKVMYDEIQGKFEYLMETSSTFYLSHARTKRYCIKCGDVETFEFFDFSGAKIRGWRKNGNDYDFTYGVKSMKYFSVYDSYDIKIIDKCSTCNTKYIDYFVRNGEDVVKVGEYPVAYEKYVINDAYKKYLPNRTTLLLKRAVFLNKNGFSKGGSIYLRTCLEYFVDYLLNIEGKKMENETMADKIKAIKHYFPEEFQTSKPYKILSEDVHTYFDVDEKEMKIRFEIIYEILIGIFDDLLEQEEKSKKRKSLEGLLHSL